MTEPIQNARLRRTPQACGTCRRRKTKCDGTRPRCRHCVSKDIPCVWPSLGVDVSQESAAISPAATTTSSVASASIVSSQLTLPSRNHLQRCFSLFFDRHFANDLCSFDYWPDFEECYTDKPFLVISIITLCARYLSPEEAIADFDLPTGRDVWSHYAPIARSMSRSTSDEPNVTNIQANLVLALSELLSNSGSSHWMYSGTAIRMAQVMRLNKEYHQRHTLREREIRRRVFWACFQFDDMIAYFLSKPRTLSPRNIGIALPSPDKSMAYGEDTRGITLETLARFSGFPSDIGLAPYFIKTLCLWSNMADINVCHRRFVDKFPPTDPRSLFAERAEAMQAWSGALPSSLMWSLQNYRIHQGLGQGQYFVALNMLMHSAFCVAHQWYLPHLDGSSLLLDTVDAAGWSLLHREPVLISTCISHAMAIGELVASLLTLGDSSRVVLQSVWVAASIMSASNIFLWLQYARDPEYSDENSIQCAEMYFDTIYATVSTWTGQWRAAREWQAALQTMRATYRAAYLGEVPDAAGSGETRSSSSSDDETSRGFRPRPGDGHPADFGMPSLYSSIRMIATDPMASHKTLQSVWRTLASGWPHVLYDLVSGSSPEILFSQPS